MIRSSSGDDDFFTWALSVRITLRTEDDVRRGGRMLHRALGGDHLGASLALLCGSLCEVGATRFHRRPRLDERAPLVLYIALLAAARRSLARSR
jgi:hypothetical protein